MSLAILLLIKNVGDTLSWQYSLEVKYLNEGKIHFNVKSFRDENMDS